MIKDRIIQLIEFKGIAKENFYKKIGVTSANFRGKAKESDVSSITIAKILSEIPDANPEWLLTGKGEMLKSKEPRTLYWRDNETGENIANKVNETPAFEINSDTIAQIRLEALHDKEKIIAMLEKDNKRLEKELQDQKRTIEQLKKELSLASNRKVGVKSDG